MAHNGKLIEVPEGMVGLPVMICTPSDVGRILRELESVDSNMLQQELSGKNAGAPVLSSTMNKLLSTNKINIQDKNERKKLQVFLADIKQSAPVIHMSFSADPTAAFMEQLLAWLRREVHPLVLVSVGLQPNIGAGCVMRTTNKYFDLSLRKNFENSKSILIDKLSKINAKPSVADEQPEITRSPAAHAKEVHA